MEKEKILRNKAFLYLTEFFAGMSVMAVELGASRLLAPYFSSSQIVWTIIIGTIMIAMALGNVYGGRSADRNPNPDKLYGRIVLAGIWIALIPAAGTYVILAVSALLIFPVSSGLLMIAAFDFYRQQRLFNDCRLCRLYDYFCFSSVFAGNSNAVAGQIFNR